MRTIINNNLKRDMKIKSYNLIVVIPLLISILPITLDWLKMLFTWVLSLGK